MLFVSYEFIAFLCVLFVLFYIIPKKGQWILLLAASYVFYAFAGLEYLAFILITTLSSYSVAVKIGKMITAEKLYLDSHRDTLDKETRKKYKSAQKKKRMYVLCAGLVLNFGILAVLKYTAFAVVNINSLLHTFGSDSSLAVPSLILPLGISFYTFQTMGYLIDVYRGKAEPEKNPAKLALFVSFFPQLIQGPISRYSDLAEQLYAEHRFEGDRFFSGLQRILWGYFKKLVIADRALIPIKTMLGDTEQYTGAYVALLVVLYSVEIYADFSGGIDITIGIAESLGINVKENFRHPFMSTSTKVYWRRWHITMGTWFTDYIFYPVSVSRPMKWVLKWGKKIFGNAVGKRLPVYLATVITWFLTGLWHGAGWNFIVWGLLNCLVILVSEELEPLYKKFHTAFPSLGGSRVYSAFMMVRTFLLMGLIRSLDCYRDVPLTFRMWGTMFTGRNTGRLFSGGIWELGLDVRSAAVMLVALALLCTVNLICARSKTDIREKLTVKPALSYSLFGLLAVAVIMFGAYGQGYDAAQFIYNQF